MSRARLLLLIGGSCSGKDELATALQMLQDSTVSVVEKETDRDSLESDGDEIRSVPRLPPRRNLLIYKQFGNSYGIPLDLIWRRWRDYRIQVLVVSNEGAIAQIEGLFGPLVVSIYVHSDKTRRDQEAELLARGHSPDDVEERIAHCENLRKMYFENVARFSHALLNVGEEEDLIDQMCRLLRHYK